MPNEYDEYRLVINAMLSREAELAGREIDLARSLPRPDSDYWAEAKPEQRSLCLVRRYIELSSDYTKLFSDRECRNDPSTIEFTKHALESLVELAENANPPMDDYAWHFRDEIEVCDNRLHIINDSLPTDTEDASTIKRSTSSFIEPEFQAKGEALVSNWISRVFNLGTSLIDWRGTGMLAAMRSGGAGLTLAVVYLLGGNAQQAFITLLTGVPVGLLFMIPLALVGMVGSKVFPPLGLLNLIPMLFMACGDPVLWVVERLRPGTVPMSGFKPLNFVTILFITDDRAIDGIKAHAGDTAKNVATDLFEKMRK